jgi:homoaconitase/3-isopropylmalate dehydratase large subunit
MNYVFTGILINVLIEDLRMATAIVKRKEKVAKVVAWLVHGSTHVAKLIIQEGI